MNSPVMRVQLGAVALALGLASCGSASTEQSAGYAHARSTEEAQAIQVCLPEALVDARCASTRTTFPSDAFHLWVSYRAESSARLAGGGTLLVSHGEGDDLRELARYALGPTPEMTVRATAPTEGWPVLGALAISVLDADGALVAMTHVQMEGARTPMAEDRPRDVLHVCVETSVDRRGAGFCRTSAPVFTRGHAMLQATFTSRDAEVFATGTAMVIEYQTREGWQEQWRTAFEPSSLGPEDERTLGIRMPLQLPAWAESTHWRVRLEAGGGAARAREFEVNAP